MYTDSDTRQSELRPRAWYLSLLSQRKGLHFTTPQ